MKYKYEVENIFPEELSFEQIQEIICKKLSKIIVMMENEHK